MIKPEFTLKVTLGDWYTEIPDLGEDTSTLQELYGDTLYGFIGMELHSVQQGQSKLFYQNKVVHPARMEDTCGSVDGFAIINIGGQVRTLGSVCGNRSIKWMHNKSS